MTEEAKKTRGPTRPAAARLAELQRKAARIEHSANEKARKEEWRTNGLAGVAAISHATAHPEFAQLLAAAIREHITRDHDKRDVADLLKRLDLLSTPSEKPDGGKRKRFGWL